MDIILFQSSSGLIKIQILILFSFVIECRDPDQSRWDPIILLLFFLWLFHKFEQKFDISMAFMDTSLGISLWECCTGYVKKIPQRHDFKRLLWNMKQAVPFSKKKGHIMHGPVRGGNVRLGLYFDVKPNTF